MSFEKIWDGVMQKTRNAGGQWTRIGIERAGNRGIFIRPARHFNDVHAEMLIGLPITGRPEIADGTLLPVVSKAVTNSVVTAEKNIWTIFSNALLLTGGFEPSTYTISFQISLYSDALEKLPERQKNDVDIILSITPGILEKEEIYRGDNQLLFQMPYLSDPKKLFIDYFMHRIEAGLVGLVRNEMWPMVGYNYLN